MEILCYFGDPSYTERLLVSKRRAFRVMTVVYPPSDADLREWEMFRRLIGDDVTRLAPLFDLLPLTH